MDSLELFYAGLVDRGFEPDSTKSHWTGTIDIEWKESAIRQAAHHKIGICLPSGFPYQAPIVFSHDNPPLAPSWHLNPSKASLPPTLCLWDSETGWRPSYSVHKLINRISDWFYHYHTNTWPTNSQVPDLNRYLKHISTVVIGDNWLPPRDEITGQFFLWQSAKYDSIPLIASCLPTKTEPEPRIADNIVLGKEVDCLTGTWFRIPTPFVPPQKLHELLCRVDNALGIEHGWAKRECVFTAGRKSRGDGFPIAIGYLDNLHEERWLFLWAQFPTHKGKRFKWSAPNNYKKITLKSYITSVANRAALLRRSAYLSTSLTSKTVLIFGVGSLGSSVALLLAKAGVDQLRLVDGDELLAGNVMRHICGLNFVGYPKTVATKILLQRHNPDCTIECFDASWDEQNLLEIIQNCDLVIDATGNINFSLFLNNICIEQHKVVMFTAAYRRARVGRIVLRCHNTDPCLACYHDNFRVWSESEYPIIPVDSNEVFIEDGCGAVTEEAVALDIEAVANFTVRQAIKLLRTEHDGNNLAIIVNEPLDNTSSEILTSPGMHYLNNKAYSDCSICRA